MDLLDFATPPWLNPKVWAAVAAVLALIAFEWWVYGKGQHSIQVKWDAQKAELLAAHTAEVERLEAVNRKVEVRYMDRVRTVQAKAQTIVKEVPKYVTQIDDSRCVIPDGFIRLLNTAAQGDVPEPSSPASAAGATAAARPLPGALHAE